MIKKWLKSLRKSEKPTNKNQSVWWLDEMHPSHPLNRQEQ